MLKDEIDKKEQKNKHKFFQKRAKDWCISTLLHIYKNENNNLFSKTKELFKKERYLNLNDFDKRNARTNIRLSPYSLVINTTKATFIPIYILNAYILLVNKECINGIIYSRKPKFANSKDFFKKCE